MKVFVDSRREALRCRECSCRIMRGPPTCTRAWLPHAEAGTIKHLHATIFAMWALRDNSMFKTVNRLVKNKMRFLYKILMYTNANSSLRAQI